MANIVVTSDTNCIKVEFNDYYADTYPISVAYYNRNELEKVELYADMVKVHMLNSVKDWELTYDGSAGFQVDTVDTVAPTSNSDLCDKIASLIKA